MSARLLRESPDLISESLALIFNQSIDTGIFPYEWKRARITPLFKKAGSRSDPSNYRPISIIPVVVKVFERIVYDQLYHYRVGHLILRALAIRASNPQNALARISFHSPKSFEFYFTRLMKGFSVTIQVPQRLIRSLLMF